MYSEPSAWRELLALIAPLGYIYPGSSSPSKGVCHNGPREGPERGAKPGVVALSHCAEQRYEEMNSGAGSLVT